MPYDYSQFDPRFGNALLAFLEAAHAAGFTDLDILSGYRSPERQAQLWEEALTRYGDPEIADNWVAPPGRSYHNHGLAADIGYAGAGLSGAPPEAVRWMHENAANFGLAFPLSNENWHIELAGARDPGGIPATATPTAQQTVAGRVSGADTPQTAAQTPPEDPRANLFAEMVQSIGQAFAQSGERGGPDPAERTAQPSAAAAGLDQSRAKLASMGDFLMPAPESPAPIAEPAVESRFWPFSDAPDPMMARRDPLQFLFGPAKPAALSGGTRIRA